MVCVPCIVIPVLLWVFHKFIQPWIIKYWNPWGSKTVTEGQGISDEELQKTEAGKYLHKMIQNNPVMIFSKTTCGFSGMAKEVFDNLGVSYGLEELDNRDDCNECQDLLQKLTGARTVPRVFVNAKCIGGGSETYSLHNEGKLTPLLDEAGVTYKKTD